MPRSPKEWLGSLAFWTCYEALVEGDKKHPDTDWASVSQDENLHHVYAHLQDALSHVFFGDEEEHLRHAVCRSAMMYWSWLRDNNMLDKRLILTGAFIDPNTDDLVTMAPLKDKDKDKDAPRNPREECPECQMFHELGTPHKKL